MLDYGEREEHFLLSRFLPPRARTLTDGELLIGNQCPHIPSRDCVLFPAFEHKHLFDVQTASRPLDSDKFTRPVDLSAHRWWQHRPWPAIFARAVFIYEPLRR